MDEEKKKAPQIFHQIFSSHEPSFGPYKFEGKFAISSPPSFSRSKPKTRSLHNARFERIPGVGRRHARAGGHGEEEGPKRSQLADLRGDYRVVPEPSFMILSKVDLINMMKYLPRFLPSAKFAHIREINMGNRTAE